MQPFHRFVYLSGCLVHFKQIQFVRLVCLSDCLGGSVSSNLCGVCLLGLISGSVRLCRFKEALSCLFQCSGGTVLFRRLLYFSRFFFFFLPVSLQFAACPLSGLCVAVTRPCLLGVVSFSSLLPAMSLYVFPHSAGISVSLSAAVCLIYLSVRPSRFVCLCQCLSVHQSRFVCQCLSVCLFSKPAVSVTTVYSGTARREMYCQRRH